MSIPKPMKFIKFRNASKNRVKLDDLNIDCAPGAECLVPEGYAFPRRAHSGGRFPSVIEDLANCPGCEELTKGTLPDGSPNHRTHCMLVPVDEADAERFSKAPEADGHIPARPKMPTVNDLVSAGVPRGVAEQIVKAAMAAAQMARDGVSEEAKPSPKKAEVRS